MKEVTIDDEEFGMLIKQFFESRKGLSIDDYDFRKSSSKNLVIKNKNNPDIVFTITKAGKILNQPSFKPLSELFLQNKSRIEEYFKTTYSEFEFNFQIKKKTLIVSFSNDSEKFAIFTLHDLRFRS